jgi:signal transduction histidine kinase
MISVVVTLRDSIAVVQISDTGIGIPPAELGHIFEPFFRVDTGRARSEGGSGLGLAIVQRIAEAHGGRVEVESRMNKGSTFSVFLPVDLADQPQSTSVGKSKSGKEQPRRLRLFFWK